MIEVLGDDGFTYNFNAGQISTVAEIAGNKCNIIMINGNLYTINETRAAVIVKIQNSLSFYTGS